MVTSAEVNPETGAGERQKEAGHLVVKMSCFWGVVMPMMLLTASSA